MDPEAFFIFTINQRIGSFEGVPGLRGYLLGVCLLYTSDAADE